MSDRKDYIKVILIALITTLVGQLIARAFTKSDMINDAATKTELVHVQNTVTKESKEYTDEKMTEHEEKDILRFNAIISKQDFMLKYLDQRFDDLEKRLK